MLLLHYVTCKGILYVENFYACMRSCSSFFLISDNVRHENCCGPGVLEFSPCTERPLILFHSSPCFPVPAPRPSWGRRTLRGRRRRRRSGVWRRRGQRGWGSQAVSKEMFLFSGHRVRSFTRRMLKLKYEYLYVSGNKIILLIKLVGKLPFKFGVFEKSLWQRRFPLEFILLKLQQYNHVCHNDSAQSHVGPIGKVKVLQWTELLLLIQSL